MASLSSTGGDPTGRTARSVRGLAGSLAAMGTRANRENKLGRGGGDAATEAIFTDGFVPSLARSKPREGQEINPCGGWQGWT